MWLCSCGELTWIVLILFRFSSDLSSFTILSINLIQSIRVGIWISLFIFHNNLTPHVLSEWMVEVCAGDKYGVLFLGLVYVSGSRLRCVVSICIGLSVQVLV